MEWNTTSKRRLKTYIYPIRRYWAGFDIRGEKWFIELNNGRVISASDPEYDVWCKRFTTDDHTSETGFRRPTYNRPNTAFDRPSFSEGNKLREDRRIDRETVLQC